MTNSLQSKPTPISIRHVFDGIRASFAYFSRIPVGKAPIEPASGNWAPAHLPLVGVCVGAASTGVLLLSQPLGPSLSAALALSVSVLLTGALHEDGLADSADALGAAHSGKRALEIMKDSHLGTFGAVSLGLSLILRYAALVELPTSRASACILVHCVARLPPVWLLASQPTVSCSPGAASMTSRIKIGLPQAATASVWGLALGCWAWRAADYSPSSLGLLAAAMVIVCWLAARVFRRAVGGITGDLLGATEQLGEVVAWLVILSGAVTL